MTELLFDALLAIALVWTALRALLVPELFRSVVLFIAFGLLLALTWARLDAPDLALAEAAIGAGLTGALLLDAVGHLHRIEDARRKQENPEGRERRGEPS
jgi:energy-converting hydrogenase B subunit D